MILASQPQSQFSHRWGLARWEASRPREFQIPMRVALAASFRHFNPPTTRGIGESEIRFPGCLAGGMGGERKSQFTLAVQCHQYPAQDIVFLLPLGAFPKTGSGPDPSAQAPQDRQRSWTRLRILESSAAHCPCRGPPSLPVRFKLYSKRNTVRFRVGSTGNPPNSDYFAEALNCFHVSVAPDTHRLMGFLAATRLPTFPTPDFNLDHRPLALPCSGNPPPPHSSGDAKYPRPAPIAAAFANW